MFVKGNLNFAAKAVVPAQKSSVASADPVLVVASTSGKFTLSSAATLTLGLEPGQSVAFADNLAEILKAVAAKAPEVVAVFEENGLDINNADDCDVFVKEMREMFIYKGYALLNADGTPKMTNARTSKEEKEQMAAANRDEIIAALQEAGVENPTDEDILNAVGSKQEPAIYGSKVSTVSEMTGLGLTLNFTDTNVWTSIKRDLDPEVRGRVKRTFKVDVKNPRTMVVNDGEKDIEVTMYPIVEPKDEEVTARGSKAEAENDANDAE